MSWLRGTLLLALLLVAESAAGDGGQVVLRESQGDWIISLLAHPVPLRAGPAALRVLVQDRDGTPVVDAEVQLLLRGPGLHHPLRIRAQPEAANRLFREVRVELARSGTWEVEVRVTTPTQRALIDTELQVGEPLGNARRYWGAIALGPLGALVIALHQARVIRSQRTKRSGRSSGPSGPL